MARAQLVPPVINYQGHLLDHSGFPVNGAVTMGFALYDAATGGTALYSETQTVIVVNGLFSAAIGSVTLIPQTIFDRVPPAGFLEISVNGTVIPRRNRFGSVAYAFNSGNANIDSVLAGAGLAAGGNTGEVTLRIADDGVTSRKILDGTIGADDLSANAVGSDAIAAGALGSLEIAVDAVGSSEIAAGAVGTSELTDNAIMGNDFADGAVGSSDLADLIDLGETGTANGTLQVLTDAVVGAATKVNTHSSGAGQVRTFNEDGGQAILLTTARASGTPFFDTENCGYLVALGPNGNYNGMFGTLVDFPNRGYISVWDRLALGSVPIAGIHVDDNDKGVVFGNNKNFRMPNPHVSDEEIWYACVEGAEAAVYVRGTARLTKGRGTVFFPDHFQIVAAPEGMTVQLTPLDASSKGLTVVAKSASAIEVRELRQGTGTYDFDWEVKSVRKGHENFQVVRSKPDKTATGIERDSERVVRRQQHAE
jgi:hypothetical protein